jgi:hypothetical protein
MEMEDDITEEWIHPKTESYFDEESVPEENLAQLFLLLIN